MYISQVADPDLRIRGGGGGGRHPDPEAFNSSPTILKNTAQNSALKPSLPGDLPLPKDGSASLIALLIRQRILY